MVDVLRPVNHCSILRKHLISMACILFLSSAVRVHDSQACRKMNVTRERIRAHHHHHHHHHHLSLNRESRWGTTDHFTSSFLHFSLFSTALWDFANSRPVQSLMLSPHLFLCLPCLLPPFTVPCKMVLARPDEREPYHYSLRLFTMVRRSSCGQKARWIFARTSLLVTWSLYEMCSIKL